jgi:hypothetical protein
MQNTNLMSPFLIATTASGLNGMKYPLTQLTTWLNMETEYVSDPGTNQTPSVMPLGPPSSIDKKPFAVHSHTPLTICLFLARYATWSTVIC